MDVWYILVTTTHYDILLSFHWAQIADVRKTDDLLDSLFPSLDQTSVWDTSSQALQWHWVNPQTKLKDGEYISESGQDTTSK